MSPKNPVKWKQGAYSVILPLKNVFFFMGSARRLLYPASYLSMCSLDRTWSIIQTSALTANILLKFISKYLLYSASYQAVDRQVMLRPIFARACCQGNAAIPFSLFRDVPAKTAKN